MESAFAETGGANFLVSIRIPSSDQESVEFSCPVAGCSVVKGGGIQSGQYRGPGEIRTHLQRDHDCKDKDIVHRACLLSEDKLTGYVVTDPRYYEGCAGDPLPIKAMHTLEKDYKEVEKKGRGLRKRGRSSEEAIPVGRRASRKRGRSNEEAIPVGGIAPQPIPVGEIIPVPSSGAGTGGIVSGGNPSAAVSPFIPEDMKYVKFMADLVMAGHTQTLR